jgi:hypothetical protein
LVAQRQRERERERERSREKERDKCNVRHGKYARRDGSFNRVGEHTNPKPSPGHSSLPLA